MQTIDDKLGAPEMTRAQFEASMRGKAVPLEGKVGDFHKKLKEDLKDHLDRNGNYESVLARHVEAAYQKYKGNLEALSTKANTAFKALGIAGDAYFFYDPIGGLGIKAISTVGRTAVEVPNLVDYVGKSGDYLSIGAFALMKAASYIPLATIADVGMKHIVKRRILKEAKQGFLREIGAEEQGYVAKLKQWYTGVKDRAKNIFRPDYEPALQPA